MVVDGRGQPACVALTTQVEVEPFREVNAQFAWDEGEGDRSLEDWINSHTAYFTRELARRNRAFSPDLLVVFERFELVWPSHQM